MNTSAVDSLPETIRVGYRDLRFRVDGVGLAAEEQARFSDLNSEIHIRPGKPPLETLDSLIHKVLHAIFEDRGLDGKGEEAIVTGVAHGLTEVFRDNPWLVMWIEKRLRPDEGLYDESLSAQALLRGLRASSGKAMLDPGERVTNEQPFKVRSLDHGRNVLVRAEEPHAEIVGIVLDAAQARRMADDLLDAVSGENQRVSNAERG